VLIATALHEDIQSGAPVVHDPSPERSVSWQPCRISMLQIHYPERGTVFLLKKEVSMFIHVVLFLLLLMTILPIFCLTILGAPSSSPEHTDKAILGLILLLGVASIPWWFVLSGRDFSGLWITWGGLVGATIGVLAPTFPIFISDIRLLRRQGYTRGLFGTRQNVKDTFDWDRTMIILTTLGYGFVTVPLGALLGLGACWFVR